MSKEAQVEEIARDLGFDLVGITPATPPRDLPHFDRWLSEAREGEMQYLRRNRDRIANPNALVPSGKSILCLGLAHSRNSGGFSGSGKVARYALGKDYHKLLGSLLKRLRELLVKNHLVQEAREIVDAGPLLERSHAAQANVGFLSKSGNLLDRKIGPWFFLAELVVDADWAPSAETFLGSCGSCRACLDACPTQAIVEPFVVDAKRCISYFTIEHRNAIPQEWREKIGDWVFGCDVCSEVCPYGWKAPDHGERFGTTAALEKFRLVDLLERDENAFQTDFAGSPIRRAKWQGMVRNALVVLGNQKDESSLPAIREKMLHPNPLIRQHAAWALGKLEQREDLDRALAREDHPEVIREIRGALSI